MRKYNINFKLLGIMGLAANLLAATFPIEPHSVFAVNGYEVPLRDKIDVQSTVTLTMDAKPDNEDASLNASGGIDPDDSGKVIRRTASIELGNTNGFTVNISGNSNLVGKNTADILPSVSTTTTLGQMSNSWGWAGSVDDDINDCNPATLSFKGMATSEQQLGSGGAVSSGTKKVTMCFGARVNGEKPADTYSNTVTLSVVAQPGQVGTFNNITKMQEMTPEICRAAKVNDTAQLEDVRDGKKYWVTKLLDGNCWMSQNLDLNLGSSVIASNDDGATFVWDNSSTYPPQATVTTINKTTLGYGTDDSASTYSWDPAEYVLNTPITIKDCTSSSGLSNCSTFGLIDVSSGYVSSADPDFYRTVSYKGIDGMTDCVKTINEAVGTKNISGTVVDACKQYDAHYLVGNYYSWNAATAGTGSSTSNYADASGSICPKGWRLPTSATYENQNIIEDSFTHLLQQYGLATTYDSGTLTGVSNINGYDYNIALSPLFFVRSGEVSSHTQNIAFAATAASYWTSASASTTNAYKFGFNGSSVTLYREYIRHYGYSLRCLVSTS